MTTKLWAALLVLFTTLLTSSAQVLWKIGSKTLEPSIASVLSNYYLLGGVLLYVIGGIFIIISFRGGEVSVLYPIIATSYIWVNLMSTRFLGESMNAFKWAGVLAIIAGIASIGFGSRDTAPGAI